MADPRDGPEEKKLPDGIKVGRGGYYVTRHNKMVCQKCLECVIKKVNNRFSDSSYESDLLCGMCLGCCKNDPTNECDFPTHEALMQEERMLAEEAKDKEKQLKADEEQARWEIQYRLRQEAASLIAEQKAEEDRERVEGIVLGVDSSRKFPTMGPRDYVTAIVVATDFYELLIKFTDQTFGHQFPSKVDRALLLATLKRTLGYPESDEDN